MILSASAKALHSDSSLIFRASKQLFDEPLHLAELINNLNPAMSGPQHDRYDQEQDSKPLSKKRPKYQGE